MFDPPFAEPRMRPLAILLLLLTAGAAIGEDRYPHPVQQFAFDSQRQSLEMAYMDVRPEGEARGTVVLLHGKNFNGAYWYQTISLLRAEGFRVVVPDQIGFGRSTLPAHYQFSLDQLAANTRALLDHLEIDRARVMGHSMGGMLAVQFALQYPEFTDQLLLLNPIGLEDWRALGVPFVAAEQIVRAEERKDFDSIRAYQTTSYYDGQWRDTYAPWARMLAEQYEGERGARFAWNMALTADMILSQPVVYQLDQLRVPTVLLIGQRDRTAIGRGLVDDELAAAMGDYPALGERATDRIPDAQLIPFEDVGHLPHIEAPQRYSKALKRVID